MFKRSLFLPLLAVIILAGCSDAPTSALQEYDTPITTTNNPAVERADVSVSFSHSFGNDSFSFNDGPVENESGRTIGSCEDGFFTNSAGNTTGGWNYEHCVTAGEGTFVMPSVDGRLQFNGNILLLQIQDVEVKYQLKHDRMERADERYLFVADAENDILWRMDLDQFVNSDKDTGNRFDAADLSATELTSKYLDADCPTTAEYSTDSGDTWESVCGTMTWIDEQVDEE